MLTINGKAVEADNLPLAQYLEEQGYTAAGIAIEYNGTILSKEQYNTVILHTGDVVEILSFVGGG